MQTITYSTARKHYKCSECGLAIFKDTKYQNIKGKYDGDWYTQKVCIHCASLISALRTYENDVHTSLSECFAERCREVDLTALNEIPRSWLPFYVETCYWDFLGTRPFYVMKKGKIHLINYTY